MREITVRNESGGGGEGGDEEVARGVGGGERRTAAATAVRNEKNASILRLLRRVCVRACVWRMKQGREAKGKEACIFGHLLYVCVP